MSTRFVIVHETPEFCVSGSAQYSVVFGLLWLEKQNPDDSRTCSETIVCYLRLGYDCTSLESLVVKVGLEVPWEYCELEEVFMKKGTTKHGLYRPSDSAIDFLPEATLPHSQIYSSLSRKYAAMEKYIMP